MIKKMLFYFNPNPSKRATKSSSDTDKFAKAEYDITVRPTQERLDAYNYIKNNGDKFDRIVVSGGDGTLNEAVKGLMEFDADKRPCLGYIPTGTTNDFASTLELPKSIAKSSDIAVNGVPFKCDIGKFNSTTFNYVAAFGAFTDVPYDTPQEVKTFFIIPHMFWRV